jgi:hypothetical protein
MTTAAENSKESELTRAVKKGRKKQSWICTSYERA